MTTYRITLSNSGGPLDSIAVAAEDDRSISEALIEYLKNVALDAGDIITVSEEA